MLYAYRQTHGELPGFRYDIGLKTKTPGFQQEPTERTADDFVRLVEIVKDVDRAVRAEAFMPQPGFMCPSCQYQQACRVWYRRASSVIVPVAA